LGNYFIKELFIRKNIIFEQQYLQNMTYWEKQREIPTKHKNVFILYGQLLKKANQEQETYCLEAIYRKTARYFYIGPRQVKAIISSLQKSHYSPTDYEIQEFNALIYELKGLVLPQ